MRWPAGRIQVELAFDGAIGYSQRAATRAFDTYRLILGDMAPEVDISLAVRHGRVAWNGDDERTTVTFLPSFENDDDLDPDALAITVLSYDGPSGRINDADIVLNGSYDWWAADEGCAHAYDVQAVLTHEIGHLLGLGHDSTHLDATMYPTALACETVKRDLSATDVDGLLYLYAVLGPAPGGCAVGGHGDGGAVVILAALVLVLARRRSLLPVALLLLGVADAGATTMRRLPLQAAGKAADVVARGRVRDVVVHRIDGRIYTDAILSVDTCMKGACAAELVVRQLGGELEGQGTTLEGGASFDVGAEVVVLLRARRDGAWSTVGMAQGVFQVERREGRVELVRDLRGLILVDDEGRRTKPQVERLQMLELRDVLAAKNL